MPEQTMDVRSEERAHAIEQALRRIGEPIPETQAREIARREECACKEGMFALAATRQALALVIAMSNLSEGLSDDIRQLDFDAFADGYQRIVAIAREIVATYVVDPVKMPWYIDLLNINLGVTDLDEARRRIALLRDAFHKDGTRITRNLDFGEAVPT